MSEVLLLASNRDTPGMGVVDLMTGSSVCGTFKGCAIDHSAVIACIGRSTSSFSGSGSGGDYIAVAQAKKPLISIWQWGKTSVHLQCHTQEIITSLAADSANGVYLVGGTRKGWLYCWDCSTGELMHVWQAHYKTVTGVQFSASGQFIVSISEDGMAKAWDVAQVISEASSSYSGAGSSRSKKSVSPYRSWTPHALPITGLHVTESLCGLCRVVTCSLDKSVIVYDLFAGSTCLKLVFPEPLKCIACNHTAELMCVGSAHGRVFSVDMSVAASEISTASSNAVFLQGSRASQAGIGAGAGQGSVSRGGGASGGGLPVGASYMPAAGSHAGNNSHVGSNINSSSISSSIDGVSSKVEQGHTKAVTGLVFSMDNCTLVSTGEDGRMITWNAYTRQFLSECKPLQKCPILSAKMLMLPESIGTGVTRPTFCTLQHLKKYQDSAGENPGNSNKFGRSSRGGREIVLGPLFMGDKSIASASSCAVSAVEWQAPRKAVALLSTGIVAGAGKIAIIGTNSGRSSSRKRVVLAEHVDAGGRTAVEQEEEETGETDLEFVPVAKEAPLLECEMADAQPVVGNPFRVRKNKRARNADAATAEGKGERGEEEDTGVEESGAAPAGSGAGEGPASEAAAAVLAAALADAQREVGALKEERERWREMCVALRKEIEARDEAEE